MRPTFCLVVLSCVVLCRYCRNIFSEEAARTHIKGLRTQAKSSNKKDAKNDIPPSFHSCTCFAPVSTSTNLTHQTLYTLPVVPSHDQTPFMTTALGASLNLPLLVVGKYKLMEVSGQKPFIKCSPCGNTTARGPNFFEKARSTSEHERERELVRAKVYTL